MIFSNFVGAMNIFHGLAELPVFKNAIVTIGSFDGVHKGHQKIFHKINRVALQYEGESVVITFDPHPREVVYPKDKTLKLLTTLEEKLLYFERYGIDNVVVVPFTIEFSQQKAREYIEKFLIDKFNPKAIIIGFDHRFGLNREGSIALLQEYCESAGFEIIQIEKQELDDITISSTKIRNAISTANLQVANQLLNHPYTLTGKVVHGDKIGHSIGFPTANLDIPHEKKLIPPDGIYAVNVVNGTAQHRGMLYIGTRPTVTSDDSRKIEVNIFDYSGDLYDKSLQIELLHFLRQDVKLNNMEELKAQLLLDKENTLNYFRKSSSAKQPSVAVVALNYNGTGILDQYMPSFEKLACTNCRIIVVDNKSTDDSVIQLRKKFPDFELIQLDQNYGFAEGYNRGLANLDFDYYALVNTDVELTPDWLDPILELCASDSRIGIVQPKILDSKDKSRFEYAGASGGYIDTLGYPFCRGRILNTIENDAGQYEDIREIFWSAGAAFVIKGKLFHDLGGFDADYFAHQEEIDLCWRVKRAGYKVMVCPQSVIYHQGGATLPYDNPRKVFLNFRNNLATLIKNEPGIKLIWLFFARLLLDGLAGLNFLRQGQWQNCVSIIKAHWNIFIWFPVLLKKRRISKQVVNKFRVGPATRAGMFRGSILQKYYLAGIRHFNALEI